MSFWFTSTLLLLSLLFLSYTEGSKSDIKPGKLSYSQSDVNKYSLELLKVVAGGYPSITTSSFSSWAESVSSTANNGLNAVKMYDLNSEDLLLVWSNAVLNAEHLTKIDPNDTSAMLEGINKMGLSAQNVALVSNGQIGKTIIDVKGLLPDGGPTTEMGNNRE